MPAFALTGINFYYETHGQGLPIIYSHGLLGDLERVKEFVVDLPNIRTILYDNRAHGRTEPLGDPADLNFARMSDDVAALLDHLDIDRAIVGGVSMGSGIALAFGLRHPDRARALILCRPAWMDCPNPANLRFAPVFADIVARYGLSATALEHFEQSGYYRELSSISPAAADSLRTVVLDADEAALLAAYRHIPASTPFDTLDRLRTLKVPALVIGNRNDPIHPYEFAEAWARSLPLSSFVEVVSRFDDAVEHTRQFRTAVVDFVRTLPG